MGCDSVKDTVCCGKPTTPRTFSVLTSTPNPKVYELKQVNCFVCSECRGMFVDKSDDFVASRLVAMGREMAEVLFDK